MNRFLIVIAIVLVSGCNGGRDSDSAADLSRASLPGVYSGVFPCEDCPGIASTLWLRSDGSFFFAQRYAADDTHEAMDAHSLGRWSLVGDDLTIELRGSGPKRAFTRLDRDTVVMLTNSNLEHRLVRDSTAPEFSATIRMEGMMHMRGGGASFAECLSGLAVPVGRGGEFARFLHQYRSAGRSSEPTFVTLEGRFSWSGDGSPKLLTIERFITVKADGGC